MRFIGFNAPLVCICIVLSSCGNKSTKNDESPVKTELLLHLENILDETESCPRNSFGQDLPGCELVEVSFTNDSERAFDPKKRILVIDSGMTLSAATRYKKRISAFYKHEPSSGINSYDFSLLIPKPAKEILLDTLNDSDHHIPQYQTADLYKKFLKKVGSYLKSHTDAYSHGSPILNYLADKNPTADFVIVQSDFQIIPPEMVCNLSNDTEYEKAKIIADQFTQSVIDIINKWNIEYINLSAGMSSQSAQGNYQPICGNFKQKSMIRFLDLWKEMLIKLGSIDNTLLVEAGVSPSVTIDDQDNDFIPDCTPIKNRVRVGYFDSLEENIQKSGITDISYLPPKMRNARACTDIFINSAFYENEELEVQERAKSLKMSYFGIELKTPISGNATSWIAPVGLSYLRYKRNKAEEQDLGLFLQQTIDRKDGFIFDPIYHDEFELFDTNIIF